MHSCWTSLSYQARETSSHRQRRLADALMDAEAEVDGIAPSELKQHRHLLRVMADGLVHQLVEGHTVRTLSQHPGKPPSITAQGPDFDFVFECARSLGSAGLIPIIADLTTLIGVGDVVGISPAGVVVLECKNTSMPSRRRASGRLARQRERGEHAEQYLTTGRLEQPDGTVKQAFVMKPADPDFDAVEALPQAVHRIGLPCRHPYVRRERHAHRLHARHIPGSHSGGPTGRARPRHPCAELLLRGHPKEQPPPVGAV